MTKFEFAEWFMKYGFFILMSLVVLMLIITWFVIPQKQKDKIGKSQCFYVYDCRNCIGKSYCKEVGLEYKDILPPYNKIVCLDNILNLTTMEYTFNILNKEELEKRYNCEVKK